MTERTEILLILGACLILIVGSIVLVLVRAVLRYRASRNRKLFDDSFPR